VPVRAPATGREAADAAEVGTVASVTALTPGVNSGGAVGFVVPLAEGVAEATGDATEVTRLPTPDVRPDEVPTPRAEALPEPKSRTKATAARQAKKTSVKRVRAYPDDGECSGAHPLTFQYAFIDCNQQTRGDCRIHGPFQTNTRRLPWRCGEKLRLSALFWGKVTAIAVSPG
jgi:hypothetical protein